MTTPDADGRGDSGPPKSPTPEGMFSQDLVSQIANEFYADTPPHQPESAIPKSDPVRGRDVTEEASSVTDVANAPENALGAQTAASPHGLADPSYYFLSHPESPESPQGTPTSPATPAPTDAMHPESSVDPLSAQGAASQGGTDATPAAAGGQQEAAPFLGAETTFPNLGFTPSPDEPQMDAPRSTPSEPPAPASADTARPESGFDPTRLQSLTDSMFSGVPSLYGTPEAGTPATPGIDVPGMGAPNLGAPPP